MAATGLLALLDDIATLLDDVAVITKLAAKKTAPVLGDDLAVNAEKLSGEIRASRELPVVWAVFKGALLNKVILVPIALLLSYFLPIVIMPLLMLGGAYLCFEGTEKIWHTIAHKKEVEQEHHNLLESVANEHVDMQEFEQQKIKSAILTDLILSLEVIVLALGTVAGQPLINQFIALAIISFAMSVGVYGLVAGIVKIDDGGLLLIKDESDNFTGKFKRGLGQFMIGFAPRFMKFLSVAGTIAMFLVGAGIISHSIHAISELFHEVELLLSAIAIVGSVLDVIALPVMNLILGFLLGAVLVAIKELTLSILKAN